MLEGQRLDGAEILVVSPTPTWPLDHGNRKRIFSVCDALKSRGAIIHFLYYPSEGDWRRHYPKNALQKMHEQWDYVNVVTPSVALHMSAKGDSHEIDEWWDEAIENEVEWLAERNEFDAMIVNYSWLSKALTFAPKGCLRVLDTHDRFSGRGAMLEAKGIDKEFFHTSYKEEFKALERADIVWAIKHDEEVFFRKLLDTYEHEEEVKPKSLMMLPEAEEEVDDYDYENTQVKTLLHVEDKAGFKFASPYKANGYLTVGIVGAYNNINLVNTREFLETALPIFEKYMVPVKVLLAGSMCKGLQDIAHPFVEQLGRVASLDDFYGRLDIALVPMTFSTGLKIKAGEALAYGVPLVAHAHAYEGYPVCHEWQAMESLEAVAEAVVEAAYNPEQIEKLKAASDAAQTALHAEVTETIDHFADELKEHRKTAVIVLPELSPGDYSLPKLNIDEIVKTLADTYRILFYYPYGLTTDTRLYLEERSTLGIVACRHNASDSGQLWGGTKLENVHEIWRFELLWNLSDQSIEKGRFKKDFHYFQDRSFAAANQSKADADCDVLVRTTMADRYTKTPYINWYHSPYVRRIEDIYKEMWQEQPDEKSRAVYILMSGTKAQLRFWHKVYHTMLSDDYTLYWVFDSDTVDWPVDNRLDPQAVAKDYSLLKDPARCAIIVNLGRSDLLMSIAWAIFICKRRIYDLEETGIDLGVLTLARLYAETIRSVKELDLNDYSNRFQHTAYMRPEFDDVKTRASGRRVGMRLKIKL